MPPHRFNKNRLFIYVLLTLGLLVAIQATHWWCEKRGFEQLQQHSEQQLEELKGFLEDTLIRYERIPQVIADNTLLNQVLNNQSDQAGIQKLNIYLEELQKATAAADVYLINSKGDAIAASNWQKENTFIGKNYSFRPYFQQAILGSLSSYYAVGVSSNKRGFYFSSPVYSQANILGVIVVKLNIDLVEQQIKSMAQSSQFEVIVSSRDDIVFLATEQSWRLASLVSITSAEKMTINGSQRYAQRQIKQLDITPEYRPVAEHHFQIYQIASTSGSIKYMENRKYMPFAKWRVHVLTPINDVYDQMPFAYLLTTCIYLLFCGGLLFSFERRRHLKRLKQAQEQLENRVKERTEELLKANEMLKESQEEVIQSAKLAAMGNLSASINHEINQPLTALRSYAQNTQSFLLREHNDKALENIQTIVELSDRLTDIVERYKDFTRKSQGKETAIDIVKNVEYAIVIVQPELDKKGVELIVRYPKEKVMIWADKTRLQQVLVNLLSNSIVAMQHSSTKKLVVEVEVQKYLTIRVKDTGPGINEAYIEKIFEPFYSTEQNPGLGLGLSISTKIVHSMKGKIMAENAHDGGAIFTVQIPIFSM